MVCALLRVMKSPLVVPLGALSALKVTPDTRTVGAAVSTL